MAQAQGDTPSLHPVATQGAKVAAVCGAGAAPGMARSAPKTRVASKGLLATAPAFHYE